MTGAGHDLAAAGRGVAVATGVAAMAAISAIGFLLAAARPASAQLALSSADGSTSLKLGVLGQLQAQDIDTPDGKKSAKDLYVRRLRLIGLFKYGDKLSLFFDTDNPNLGKGNADGTKNVSTSTFIQDLVLGYAFAHELQLEAGEMLLPTSFDHVSGASTLLTLDYGAFTFNELAALQSNNGRDYGLQARGYLAGDHLEYRLGGWQGNRGKNEVNSFRYSGRLSLWVMGTQTGIYYTANSLGKRQSMEIGGSFDRQKQYSAYTGDFFWDQPVGGGNAFTAQVDYTRWDGGTFVDVPKQSTVLVEAGFYVAPIKSQPFFQYSDQSFDHHSHPDQKRTTFGLGFYPYGHTSDLKFAYTRLTETGQGSRNQYQLQYQVYVW
jgi:Phosphate-selective porin O and P